MTGGERIIGALGRIQWSECRTLLAAMTLIDSIIHSLSHSHTRFDEQLCTCKRPQLYIRSCTNQCDAVNLFTLQVIMISVKPRLNNMLMESPD